MSRRGKGEGSLTRRTDGLWQGSYTGSDSKRHYVYGRTRKIAHDKLLAALRDLEAGVYVTGQSQPAGVYLTRWLARADHLRPITRKRYEALLRLHAIPHIGAIPLRKVQPQHIADLYAALRGTRSPATIAQLHAVLHSAFDQALRWNMVARNPVAAVKAPKVEQREMRVLSLPEIHAFLDAISGDPLEALYTLAVTTGARQGELLALRWRDLDLDAAAMSINATLTRIDGHWERTPPKTAGSVRTVHLSARAVRSLRAHRLRMAEELLPLRARTEGDTLVFLHHGEAVNGFHVTERAFKPLLRRHGLPAIRFHDLRHVFVSLMLSNGVRVDLISKMLGHASPTVTMGVYAHLMPGDQEAAMAQLDAVLGA